MQCLNAYNLKFIYEKNMQLMPLQWQDKSEYVSMHFFTRCAPKKYINNYQIQIHSWEINAVLITFEAKKSINSISKSGCPNVHAL